jgi:uncharacterized membrane protein
VTDAATGGSVVRLTLTTRRIVVAGVLAAISVLLGFTGLGYIPMPNLSTSATIMGVPAYIGSVLEGWPVGVIIGFIFGLSSFAQATSPLFKDPTVAILPRLVIGITPYLAYRALRSWNQVAAFGVAGAVGSATNTVLVVAAIILRHYATFAQMLVVIPQAVGELILSVILTTVVCAAWNRIQIGSGRARISQGD